MKNALGYLLLSLILILCCSCTENLFVDAVPTPEGRKAVDDAYESIVGLDEVELVPDMSFREFLHQTVFSGTSAEDRAVLDEILDWMFPGKTDDGTLRLDEVRNGLDFRFLKGFDKGSFEALSSLHTRADIRYLNRRMGKFCEAGKLYTEILSDYYAMISTLVGGNTADLFTIKEQQELRIADAVTFRIATRLIFNTLIDAVYTEALKQDFSSVEELEAYVNELDANLIYTLVQEKVIDDVLNSVSLLNKLRESTSVIDIKFVEAEQ